MRRSTFLLLILFAAATASAQTAVMEESWAARLGQGSPLSAHGEMSSYEGVDGALKISAKTNTVVELLRLSSPPVSGPMYAFQGAVAYQNVGGQAYFELINDFGQNGSYFTRTLAQYGPMMMLNGSSSWRTLSIPFSTGNKPWRPQSLTLRLILPAGGTVFISPLKLIQHQPQTAAAAPLDTADPVPYMAYGGALFGGLIGFLGAVTGFLTPAGKGRTLILAAWKTCCCAGFGMMAAGAVLMSGSEPSAAAQPLLIFGGLMFGISLPVMVTVKRRYTEVELRRMNAQDLP